jgi:dephospho-CoA kinase
MKKIICIVGTIGSGKDVAAEYISKKLGISVFQASQPLRDIAKERGIEPIRWNLIKLGNEILKEKGPQAFVERLIGEKSENLVIITGVRIPSILDYIQKNYNLILLAVDADAELRFNRSIARGKLGEAKTLEEFLENEQKENSAPNMQRLFECMKLADYTIYNNTDLKTFFEKIDEFLKLKELESK